MALALLYWAIRSSSMQPPETEPTTAPVSHKAMMEPTGRGDEPQVRTTVVNMALSPASRQVLRVRKTTMSKFSIRLFNAQVNWNQRTKDQIATAPTTNANQTHLGTDPEEVLTSAMAGELTSSVRGYLA